MRIAVAGKGGSGKTTLAALITQQLTQRGRCVLAIDGDTNPNLAQTLGIPDAHSIAALPNDLLVREEQPDGQARVKLALPVSDIIERYAAGPASLRLLVMGRVDHAGAG